MILQLVAYVIFVILIVLILSYVVDFSTTIGAKYYEPDTFRDSLKKILETISKYRTMFVTSLYTAASLAFSKGFKSDDPVDHHIIARSSSKATTARDIYTWIGGDVNSAENIVTIKESFHQHLHSDIYYIAVNALIAESYYFHGEESKERSVRIMLGTIKLVILLIDAIATFG